MIPTTAENCDPRLRATTAERKKIMSRYENKDYISVLMNNDYEFVDFLMDMMDRDDFCDIPEDVFFAIARSRCASYTVDEARIFDFIDDYQCVNVSAEDGVTLCLFECMLDGNTVSVKPFSFERRVWGMSIDLPLTAVRFIPKT